MADFGSIKAQARQAVHDQLSVAALYSFEKGTPIALTVTHRDRNGKHGDLDGDYASVAEGTDTLKFNKPQLTAKAVTLQRAGLVTIPSDDDAVYELDQRIPSLGPINEYWSVVRVPS